ncbi:hypothetical protein EJ05DRAFT_503508 [Pseudovirgaria hyperparasitica]|uniref:F-box domain-containing protein n=1 Tax=Pseudovirgaria hyperparasitica TaxID=470096 RepID=A0A6A6VX73_9PEZI|nr:uncharacterized protein EJ05DRAFT_503508 [Pseudovirgaria hyperparasitica]KAF2755202.1 hypothetical protein EJ05DRAFT_503508 [Pseudovirgaria hyperparasitica]
MPKRSHHGTQDLEQPSKRRRLAGARLDRLSDLSDELLLRILSFLSTGTLVLCRRVSTRLKAVATDSQLWKAAYYNRFVRPRALRLPGISDSAKHLLFSSKSSKWLDEEYLVRRGETLDWMKQYKLRHNWTRGSCAVSEISISDLPPAPPLLLRYHNGIVFTLDSSDGLRAWSSKERRELLATSVIEPHTKDDLPTSMAVDESNDPQFANQDIRISIGFHDGRFCIYSFQPDVRRFARMYEHARSSIGRLSAMTLRWPYLTTMSETRQLSIYKFAEVLGSSREYSQLAPPRLLSSLKSHTTSKPLSLSMKITHHAVVASIAYTLPTYFSGYSVGIQEVRLSLDGDIVESRLATADHGVFQPLHAHPQAVGESSTSPNGTNARDFGSFSTPTSLSYTHPYLLVAHPDNTLTLYLVTSSLEKLAISPGSRLWGHTSSVSGAHVGGRGRAVSVSCRGGEMRVWELEGGVSSLGNRKRLLNGELSIRVKTDRDLVQTNQNSLESTESDRGFGLGLSWADRVEDSSVTRGWVGFDDENVVVLKELAEGAQALVVYDFT